ncbi:MAG: hypothetical protein EXR83_02675 [Gammaproteobacteria bacterium]|nr:hypothetical protein [Gammaproteobacteria bacterium]
MLRKTAVALAISLVMPSAVWAVGLGALKTSSMLSQPFVGKVDILGATAADFQTLSVKLADAAQFERAGITRTAGLLKLRFEIIVNAGGVDYIRVTSSEPVREPFLDFLVEMTWAQGSMVREYTVLLDPPIYVSRRTPSAAPARLVAASARAELATPPNGTQTLMVAANDTAWALAMRYRVDPSVSVQQMMLGLVRANPESFPTGNVNVLRAGAVLRIPAVADVSAISRAAAAAEIQRQTQAWQDYRRGVAAQPALQMSDPPVGEAAALPPLEEAPDTPATPAAAPKVARLEVVTPVQPQAAAVPASKGGLPPSDATTDILGEEAATTQTSESAELTAKLTEAEGIIDLLQRQVQIKDEELARLQATLAGAGGLASTPAVAPAAGAPAAPAAATPADPLTAALDAATPASDTATPASDTAPPTVTASQPPPDTATPAPDPAPPTVNASQPPPASPPANAPTTIPAPPVVPEPETALDALVPASWRNLVPGGALAIIGILGTLLALGVAALVRTLAGRRVLGERASPPAAATLVAVVAPAPSPTQPVEAPTDVLPTDAFDPFSRTLETSSEALTGEPALDPLEEVNVYLAYERFDQAEELVREVIARYPREPKYQLRLLEIYYSANRPEAYEVAAAELRLAVGENSALWESAVAMWNEMSPTHALLAPHEVEPAGAAAIPGGASVEFVDLTTLGETPPSDTLGELDFDLGELSADSVLGDVLDFTSDQIDERHVLDLTSTVEKLEQAGFLPKSPPEPAPEIFDVSGESAAGAPLQPPYEITNENVGLLDLSATGDVFDEPSADTLAGLTATASSDGLGVDATGDELLELDFDLSENSLPPEAFVAVAGELDFDLAGLASNAGEAPAYDPNSLAVPPKGESTAPLINLTNLPEPAEEEFSFDLELDNDSGYNFDDLNIAADVEQDLQLQNPPLDLQGTANADASDEELAFDLALQDTTDFAGVGVDDTLEMPIPAGVRLRQTPEESLEDLTRSLEASLAGFDFEQDGATDEPAFDFDLSPGTKALGDNDALDLEFELDSPEPDGTNNFDRDDDAALEATGMHFGRTSLRADDAEEGLPAGVEEAENKLNLAKAYIELGEHEAARTMLEEVEREGTPGQRDAVRRLLGQIR